MCFLISFFCIPLFCAIFTPDAIRTSFFEEEEHYTEENAQHYLASVSMDLQIVPGTLSALILADLQGQKRRYLSESLLKRHIRARTNNKNRSLFMAVISLRNKGYNIAHIQNKGFALLDGTREVRQDCYKRALWDALTREKDLFKTSDVLIALSLSDVHYRVQYMDVCSIKALWQLIFNKNDLPKGLHRKKKAWDVIVQDFDVYERHYYMQHPLVQEAFTPADITSFKKMFDFYKEYAEWEDPQYRQIKERLYQYLKICMEGATLQDIQDFLQCSGENINVWMGIRIIVRGGYGGQIHYLGERVFLKDIPEKPYVVKSDLMANICDIFKENPSCEYITLALYKRGFYTVNPFDVRNILDVLMRAGRLVACCDDAERCREHDEVIFGPGSDGCYLQELKDNKTFWKIQEEWPCDIMSYLKVCVYPKYFGWHSCESVALKEGGKKHKKDFDVTMAETKKPCLEEGVLVPEEDLRQYQGDRSMLDPLDQSFQLELPNLSRKSMDEFFDDCGDIFFGDESLNASDDTTPKPNDSALPSDFNVGCYFHHDIASPGQASESDLNDAPGVSSRGGLSDSEEDSDGSGDTESVKHHEIANPGQASESDLNDAPGVSSRGGLSDSEEDSDGSGDTESVKACAQKRQKLLLEYLKQKENEFCSSEELQALYGGQGTKATVLEDAVSLIHSHHNIEYNKEREQYRLCSGPWPVRASEDNAKKACDHVQFLCQSLIKESFAALNIGEKTYYFYEHGYRSVPLSTLALLVTMRRPKSFYALTKREKRVIAVKDEILEEETIKGVREYTHIEGLRSEDLGCIKESFGLYTDGCAILAKNTQKKVCVRRRNRQEGGLTSYPEVMEFMKKTKGQIITEAHLKKIVNATSRHRAREAISSVGDLRACGMNIVHNVQEAEGPTYTFILCDGYRETKPGCFKKVLWRMLDGQDLSSVSVKSLFLTLSNLGYNPGWSVVERIVMLKKLYLHDATVNSRKLAAWEMIMQDKELHNADYYAKRSNSAVCLDAADMKSLTYCWGLYNAIFYHYDYLVSQKTKDILEQSHAEGIAFPDFRKALLASLPKRRGKKTNGWCALSDLMRRGYAGKIDLIGERVVWRPGGPNIAQTNNTICADFCNIPLGYEYGPAAVFLHKRGHLNVSPWDVAQLLDIFAFLRCREENRYHYLQELWANIQNGRELWQNLPHREAVFIKRIKWLQSMGVLAGIKDGCVSLEKILNEEEWFLEEEKGALL